jgi:hypothetical protein
MVPGSLRSSSGTGGGRFASSALMAPMTAAFTAGIGHFIGARGLDLVRFARGQRKENLTREYLHRAEVDDRGLVPEQVLYAGVAQEKQKVFRTSKRRNPVTGAAYPWLVPTLARALGLPGAILALGNTVSELCAAAFGGDLQAQAEVARLHIRSLDDFPAGLKQTARGVYGTSAATRPHPS